MPKSPQKFYVYDGKSYIGCYYALTPKAAIARAQAEINAGCSTFRRSQAPIYFTNSVATIEWRSYDER